MRGRLWLVLGALLGVAVAAGRIPYLAGAGRSLADTAEHLMASAASRLIAGTASAGAPRRAVLALTAVVGISLPGVTALGLVVAAKGTLLVRSVIAVLVAAIGAASFAYQPHGAAAGVLVLALAIAGLAVSLTGPLLAAPLAGLAGLIGGEFLPGLLSSHRVATQANVSNLHLAIFNSPGTPAAMQLVCLALAAVPFAVASWMILRP